MIILKFKWLKNTDSSNEYCDYNPLGYSNKHSFGIVFNTDKHDSGGRHWMSMYINVKNKAYFIF